MTQPMTQQQHYQAMIQATQHVLEQLKTVRAQMAQGAVDPSLQARARQFREDMAANFNRFQQASVQSIQLLDQAVAQMSVPDNPHHAQAIQLLDQAIGKEGEALHHLFGMMQGRRVVAAPAAQPQPAPAPAPNVVEASTPATTVAEVMASIPPTNQSQVSEVIEANGTRTVFENGQAVAVVPPPGNGPTVQ